VQIHHTFDPAGGAGDHICVIIRAAVGVPHATVDFVGAALDSITR